MPPKPLKKPAKRPAVEMPKAKKFRPNAMLEKLRGKSLEGLQQELEKLSDEALKEIIQQTKGQLRVRKGVSFRESLCQTAAGILFIRASNRHGQALGKKLS